MGVTILTICSGLTASGNTLSSTMPTQCENSKSEKQPPSTRRYREMERLHVMFVKINIAHPTLRNFIVNQRIRGGLTHCRQGVGPRASRKASAQAFSN
ncbi:hypothetical protein Plhal304r1_c015g0054911 [Plasmopara halstedii]